MIDQFLYFPCSFNIALWPVWSFFTPLILFTQFMGVVMFISLLGWMWQVRMIRRQFLQNVFLLWWIILYLTVLCNCEQFYSKPLSLNFTYLIPIIHTGVMWTLHHLVNKNVEFKKQKSFYTHLKQHSCNNCINDTHCTSIGTENKLSKSTLTLILTYLATYALNTADVWKHIQSKIFKVSYNCLFKIKIDLSSAQICNQIL